MSVKIYTARGSQAISVSYGQHQLEQDRGTSFQKRGSLEDGLDRSYHAFRGAVETHAVSQAEKQKSSFVTDVVPLGELEDGRTETGYVTRGLLVKVILNKKRTPSSEPHITFLGEANATREIYDTFRTYVRENKLVPSKRKSSRKTK